MLWNYLCGYVIIQIKGLALERFVNRALSDGIDIWDVKREADGSMSAKVGVGGFYALRRLLRHESWSVHICMKHGLIMRLSALRDRKVLLYGWIPVLLLLFAASRMVWFIDIEGCDRVSPKAILETLENTGVGIGTKRRSFTLGELNEAVQNSDERIAVASVTVSGVVMHVEIREAQEKQMREEGERPGSIVAEKDGFLLSVTALCGHSVAKRGQTVKAGELLITGDLTREGGEALLVRARGRVIAQTVYTGQSTSENREEAVQRAEKLALSKVDPQAVIIEKSSRVTQLEDGKIQAIIVIAAREDIAKFVELE